MAMATQSQYSERRQGQSIMDKTNYASVKPTLRKYCPEEWGRFLDGHYKPGVHKSSFVVATKVPDP
jgi:hypothetical protein